MTFDPALGMRQRALRLGLGFAAVVLGIAAPARVHLRRSGALRVPKLAFNDVHCQDYASTCRFAMYYTCGTVRNFYGL